MPREALSPRESGLSKGFQLEEPLVSVTLIAPAEHVGGLIAECEARSGVQQDSWVTVPSTLPDDRAPSARLVAPRAQPTPRAQPQLLGSLPWPQWPASGRPKAEDLPLSTARQDQRYLGADRAVLRYTLPLAEIATDFHDRVKSLSNGFASLDYEAAGHQPADVVILTLRVNGHDVDAMSRVVRRPKALPLAREMVAAMKENMEREIVDVTIQAVANYNKVLARETIKARRKDVLAKCYGGDITRKKKLLEKQKEGKKRRSVQAGPINIPSEAFLAVLSPGAAKKKKSR